MSSGFVHLHVHSEYSLLDGACRLEELVEKCARLGQKGVALTDHGVMYGAVDFYKAAKAAGVNPIIGCEVYTAPRSRFDKEYQKDSDYGHLVLLAENNDGYRNLIRLVSDAWLEGFYFKPRVDLELLEKYSGGLIALSACLAGDVPRALLNKGYEEAKAVALNFQRIFGRDNFFLEIQDHGISEQKQVIAGLSRLSKETGIPLVATNDSHYIDKAHADIQFALMCIQMNKTVDEGNRMGFENPEFYIKSAQEMQALFEAFPEALENTVKIAQRCKVDFEFGQLHLPNFVPESGEKPIEALTALCRQGLSKRYGEEAGLHRERLNYELETIVKMGYVDYFLIVHDFVRFAKDRQIPVGPGRGSAAGSIVSYCLEITDVDPIRFGLLFERFLNPERISMPDIDIDFCYERRQEVIDYVVHKYGQDRVAQIITFGTMAARAAIRDVGRALNVPYPEVDAIAKMVPFELGMTLARALHISQPLSQACERDPKIKKLLDTAKGVEGMPRHASTHAAGVVITGEPVSNYVPLQQNDGAVTTQFTMGTLEELGLLKMDFLGLRNLTVIQEAEDMIRKKTPDFSAQNIDYDDKAVFDMLSTGHTDGIFQLESAGMRQVIINLKPQNLEDITAAVALYRPGPMDSIPRYIQSRHNPDRVSYTHPLLTEILDVTYGCIVYQEQVMQIVTRLAGYSYGRADLVRRAMSKKKADVMEKEREYFIYGKKNEDGTVECCGAVQNGVPEKVASAIFDDMADFARYAFNKSHAVCYAVIAYKTAWLKHYHPREYMAALLTSVLDSGAKVAGYIVECNRLGIKVLPPDVNESMAGFTVSGENIRFGLVAVKNIGKGFIFELIAERESGGRFRSFFDFCERICDKDINRRAMESLIKSGALDTFGVFRSQMMASFSSIIDSISQQKKKNLEGQMDLFSDPSGQNSQPLEIDLPPLPEFGQREKLAMEKEVTGLYLSGHPMADFAEAARSMGAATTRELIASEESELPGLYRDGETVTFVGVLAAKKLKTTKNDSMMAFISVEDMFGSIEVLVFPKILEKCGSELVEGAVLTINGRVSVREEEAAKLIAESVEPFAANSYGENPSKGLLLSVPSANLPALKKARQILEIFSGNTPVRIFCSDSGETQTFGFECWVTVNRTVLSEMKRLLGSENVSYLE